MPDLRIFLFGSFQVQLEDHPLTFDYVKVQALLAYLVVEANQPVQRDKLATMLWPESSQQAAHNGLRQALARLRITLEDRHTNSPYILAERDTLQVNPQNAPWCDVHHFDQILSQRDAHPHDSLVSCSTCAALQSQLLELYRGDFLDWLSVSNSILFEEWAQIIRERKRLLVMDALGNLGEFHHHRGDFSSMLQVAMRQVELDPLHEPAHRQVMLALAGNGQRSQAVIHFNDLAALLHKELGILPSAETMGLLESIKDETV